MWLCLQEFEGVNTETGSAEFSRKSDGLWAVGKWDVRVDEGGSLAPVKIMTWAKELGGGH